MEDKIVNLLILIIVIIIISLGLLYVYTMLNNKGYVIDIPTAQEIKEGKTIVISKRDKSTSSTATLPPVMTRTSPSPEEKSGQEYDSSKIIGNKENNRHYYNQLNNYSKIIYDTIIDNLEQLTQGNYTMHIEYDFHDLLSKQNGSDELEKYYDDAIYALNLDLPNLFYIDLSKISLNIETTTTLFSETYKLYMNNGENLNYFAKSFYTQKQVEEAIEKINNVVNDVIKTTKGSKYEQVRLVHDWIIENLEYDDTSQNKGTIFGACIEKKAVCEGYARTYKYMLDKLGIENVLVVGRATNSTGKTEDHMWNYIKMDETWYAVDITWDDPIIYGSGIVTEDTKHTYFLVGSEKLFKNHVEENVRIETGRKFVAPKLGKNDY